ncbi:hypothetical protein ACKC9G_09415 [Pokkaliibacter sp. CJK22405]|uniref:hypothetical protein n=1 Tax=Pokkaliibacter sp. CJK22405 TaxID=3384615 RepID=UPI003984BE94
MAININALDLARHAALGHVDETPHPAREERARPPAGTLEALEQKLEQLKQMQQRQQLPMQSGSLEHAIRLHLAHKSGYERMVNADWLSTPFVQRRKEEYKSIPGGEDVSAQYGLSMAQANNNLQHRQMKVNTEADAIYNRATDHHGMNRQLMMLLHARGGNPREPHVFVNSQAMVNKLTQRLGPQLHQPLQSAELNPGVFAVRCESIDIARKASRLITVLGGRPSVYQMMANRNGPPRDRVSLPGTDVHQVFGHLKGLNGKPSVADQLRNLPENHGHAAVCNAAAKMIDELTSTMEAKGLQNQRRRDPILQRGLQGVHMAAMQMTTLHGDSAKLFSAFQILAEEMQVCLTQCKPYGLQDFRKAGSAMLAGDKLAPSALPPTMFLTTSGMGALSNAVEIAGSLTAGKTLEERGVAVLTNGEGEKSPVYYEMNFLKPKVEPRALYATLNQSQPGREGLHKHNWGVEDVISGLCHHLDNKTSPEPTILVLDATVERKDDMDKLVHSMKADIESGQLKIIVNKSYQKYTNLGTGKVMAGGTGIISNDDALGWEITNRLADHEQGLNWIKNPETQLLTHMLKCRDQELALIERGSDNARFVKENFFHGKDGHVEFLGHDDHLPFATFLSEQGQGNHLMHIDLISGPGFPHAADTSDEPFSALDHLSENRIGSRASFGFSMTTFSPLGNMDNETEMRLCMGQETQAELTEIFYMPSRLLTPEGSLWDANRAEALINELVRDALKQHPMPPGQERASLAQKLEHIARAEQPRVTDEQRMNDPLKTKQLIGQDGGAYTIHKVASVMVHLAEFINKHISPEDFPCQAPGRGQIDHLLKSMLNSGMPGISMPARMSILELQSRLRLSDMHFDGDNMIDHFHAWMNDLERYPNTPIRMQSPLDLPPHLFDYLGTEDRSRLTKQLFNGTDLSSRIQFVSRILHIGVQIDLAEHLLAELDNELARAARHPRANDKAIQNTGLQLSHLRQHLNMQLDSIRSEEEMDFSEDGSEMSDSSDNDSTTTEVPTNQSIAGSVNQGIAGSINQGINRTQTQMTLNSLRTVASGPPMGSPGSASGSGASTPRAAAAPSDDVEMTDVDSTSESESDSGSDSEMTDSDN